MAVITTQNGMKNSIATAESAGRTIHKIQRGRASTNCIVVWGGTSFWTSQDGTSLIDDILFHSTDHDVDLIFLRDPTIEDTWYFGDNLKFEDGESVAQFDFEQDSSTESLSKYLTDQRALYSGGKFIYLGTDVIASYCAVWHSLFGEGEDEPGCDALIAWSPQHNPKYLVDTLGGDCDLSEAPILQKIRDLTALKDGSETNLYNLVDVSHHPVLSINRVNDATSAPWPATTVVGYWDPQDIPPPPCSNDDYYLFHFDNYDETDGFKKYDSHIDISHGLKDTWVGKIRDELGVVISN